MTRHAHLDASANAPPLDLQVTAGLHAARARLRRARLAHRLSIDIPVAVAAVALAGWWGPAGTGWLAAGGVAVVAVVALVTAIRTPWLPEVAALLDARLQLADRLSTAFSVMPRTDAVARLIVRDAAPRLTSQALPAAIPYQPHPWASAAVVAALACLSLWMLAPAPPEGRPGGDASAGSVSSAPPRDRPATGAARSNDTSPTSPTGAGPAPDSSPRPPAAPADGGADGREGSSTTRQARDGAGDTEPLGRAGDASAVGSQGNGDGAAAAAGERSAAAAPSAAARGAQAGLQGAPAPGRGAAMSSSRSSTAEGAGGVRRGTLADNQSVAIPPRDRIVSPTSVARGRQAAEAAIAHDDVPPRRRAYLRDYYQAVGRLNEP